MTPSATASDVSIHSRVARLKTRPPVIRRSAASSPRATAIARGVARGAPSGVAPGRRVALDGSLYEAVRLGGGVEHLAAIGHPEARHVEGQVVAVW
jgi:hypothetical protein